MLRALALASSLFLAQYGPAGIKTYVFTEPLTRPLPILTTEGVDLRNATAIRVTVCGTSPTSNTAKDSLTGVGTIRFFYLTPEGWGENVAARYALSVVGTCETLPEVHVPVSVGRIIAAPSSVVVSGASTVVSVRYEMSTR